MEHPGTAYLDIRLSTEPGKIWRTVALTDEVTLLGRPEAGEPGVDLICAGISRQHACVRRTAVGEAVKYTIENLAGKGGIRIYAKILHPGECHVLHHSHVFHIPAMLVGSPHRSYQITFCENPHKTTCLSIEIYQPPRVSIFGHLRKLDPLHYNLLSYLYKHKNEFCLYSDIFDVLWPPGTYRPADPGESLRSHKSRVNSMIREVSGGVELIETIHGEGLCLRI